MKLLALLLVLALRRMDLTWPAWLQGEERVQRRVLPWWQQLGTPASTLHWVWAVLLPSLLLALVFYILGSFAWGVLAWGAGILLLLWLWGVESEFKQMDELLACGRLGDRERLYALAADSFQVTEGEDFFRRLQAHFLLRDAQVVFASIFWLVLLGYWAVFFYLLNRVYRAHYQIEEEGLSASVDELLFYPVARLLVLGMALASDFQRVMQTVRGKWLMLDSQRLLELAMAGALSHCDVKGEDEFTQQVDRLDTLHAILLRTLALWLVVAAIWVMLLY